MACLCILPVYGTAGPVTRGEAGDYGPDGNPVGVYPNSRWVGKPLWNKRIFFNVALMSGLHVAKDESDTLDSDLPSVRRADITIAHTDTAISRVTRI